MFAICNGSVKIGVPSVDGHDTIFNLLGKGAIFGEIAILDGRPRTADAVAATDCELFVIERRDFVPILRTEPDIALKLIEVLCARLRRTSAQAENLMFRSLPSRLSMALLQLSDSGAGERNPKVAVTQRDLGNIIGMSRESTNKQLRSWEANNWVRLERGGILIMCFEALISIAESDGALMRS
jgi:CRP/FNR family cyclic AMP-dependent transcriptional regulator